MMDKHDTAWLSFGFFLICEFIHLLSDIYFNMYFVCIFVAFSCFSTANFSPV